MAGARLVATLLLPLLALAVPAGSLADIYKWTDKNGVVHFSDADAGQPRAEKVEVKINTYRHVTYQKLKPGTTAAAGDKRIVMYGTRWCGYCKKARAYFAARQLAFTDLDVETDPGAKAAFERLGGRGVPVILVGDTRINGFNEKAFEKVYRQP